MSFSFHFYFRRHRHCHLNCLFLCLCLCLCFVFDCVLVSVLVSFCQFMRWTTKLVFRWLVKDNCKIISSQGKTRRSKTRRNKNETNRSPLFVCLVSLSVLCYDCPWSPSSCGFLCVCVCVCVCPYLCRCPCLCLCLCLEIALWWWWGLVLCVMIVLSCEWVSECDHVLCGLLVICPLVSVIPVPPPILRYG